jgi:hypothetical protein
MYIRPLKFFFFFLKKLFIKSKADKIIISERYINFFHHQDNLSCGHLSPSYANHLGNQGCSSFTLFLFN